MALAVDVAVGDRADDAALVGAHGREAPELAVRRLGDDDLVLGEDRAAADLDVGGRRRRRPRRPTRWDSPPPTPRRWACCSVTVCSGRWPRHCSSEPLHAARTGSPTPIVAMPAMVRRWTRGLGRSVMRATVRTGGGPPHCPGVLGPRSQPTHSSSALRPTCGSPSWQPASSPLPSRAFLAAAFAAAALRARLAGLGCSASRPSSSGSRNWPV